MPLQKQFRGIQQFLGLYNQGTHAFDLSSVIQPVVNMEPFAEEPEYIRAAATFTAAGQQMTFETVPDNEIWRVYQLGANLTANATVTAGRFQPTIFHLDNFFGLSMLEFSVIPGQTSFPGVYFGKPGLTLFPGMTLSWLNHTLTGGGASVAGIGVANIQRIKV